MCMPFGQVLRKNSADIETAFWANKVPKGGSLSPGVDAPGVFLLSPIIQSVLQGPVETVISGTSGRAVVT